MKRTLDRSRTDRDLNGNWIIPTNSHDTNRWQKLVDKTTDGWKDQKVKSISGHYGQVIGQTPAANQKLQPGVISVDPKDK